jgi:hypothetical protein
VFRILTRFGSGGDLFKPEYTEEVEELCKLGVTDKDLCLFFNVSMKTLYNWKKNHPVFFGSLSRGKQEADKNVASTLYRNAVGYDYYEDYPMKLKKETIHADGTKTVEVFVKIIQLKKRKHPDTTAQIFWLKNRRPDLWRDVRKSEHEHKTDADTYGTLRGKAAPEALKQAGFVELEGEYTIIDDDTVN